MAKLNNGLNVGDVVKLEPSIMKIIHSLGITKREAENDHYMVTKVGRKYYHLSGFYTEKLAYHSGRSLKVEMVNFHKVENSFPQLLTVFSKQSDEWNSLLNRCVEQWTYEVSQHEYSPYIYRAPDRILKYWLDILCDLDFNAPALSKALLILD